MHFRRLFTYLVGISGLWSLPHLVLAHEGEMPKIGVNLQSQTLSTISVALAILLVLALIAVVWRNPQEWVKRIMFGLICLTVLGASITIIYLTISVNVISWSHGPVHWHADYEVWACGEKLDLVNPHGFSNKVGTAALHEHNDGRIHYEGVAVTPNDATLGHYFEVVGGHISQSNLVFPTNDGVKTYQNGDSCGNPGPGQVQVFIYKVSQDQTISQRKSLMPESHIMFPSSQVPPGECIIVEFDAPKLRTDKLCHSYQAAQTTGKLKQEMQ